MQPTTHLIWVPELIWALKTVDQPKKIAQNADDIWLKFGVVVSLIAVLELGRERSDAQVQVDPSPPASTSDSGRRSSISGMFSWEF